MKFPTGLDTRVRDGAPSRVLVFRVGVRSSKDRLLTLAKVAQVQQLVTPLCEDTQRILDERDDDQKTTNDGKVPDPGEVSAAVH